ncbi:aspartate aminotransferase family protein [Alkalicoccobacillus porphyridii]|uniref:Aminotransferase class III-fold pyridoxal phosphate-dependent enzyme n=1 Tax=Alkalicoccobacillus porphyridii TaxID=2597270 RepID=A0A553ZVC0_9BACI|nr:acetylornithine transaminase [Alkalicoccobacillus porphyridii]TSB45407.1 aminotransferase class III-fold pyridoxal phosphate-dependent enzyme [Alkalicoccobacillus porphyridii]
MSDWSQRNNEVLMNTYGKLPLVVDRGEGAYLFDEEGRQYLDFITGLAVNIVGHSHPKVVQTLREQGEKFLHISNLYVNKPAVELAERLLASTFPGKVFYTNSGAEATEAVIKLIHKWTKAQNTGQDGIVVLKKSFHGRTLGALKLTRQPGVYQDFPVSEFPVYDVEPHDLHALEDTLKQHKPAALLMEPVLGSGGVVPLESNYVEQAATLCQKYNVLFCMDEIQTGIGRTGKLFAYQHTSVTPDVVLFAKGIGGGLPLGGILVKTEHSELFKPGDHGTTFAPSPLSAALGHTVIQLLEDDGLLEQGRTASEKLHAGLRTLKTNHPDYITSIRGIGMMIGVVMNLDAGKVKQIQQTLLERGMLVDVTQQTIIRLLPPLIVSDEQIDFFLTLFQEVLEEVSV